MKADPQAREASARLLALNELNLLDTPADPLLDGLVRSAATLLHCPIALISLVDKDRQWFKAQVGLDLTHTAREDSFCTHAIQEPGLFVIPDASADPRFAGNPLVTGAPQVRFYAGAPLVVDGRIVGTLCVLDRVPRSLDDPQRALLTDMARVAEHWIVSSRERHRLRETENFLAKIARYAPGVFYQFRLAVDGSSRFPYASAGIGAIYELSAEAVLNDAAAVFDRLHPADADGVRASIALSAQTLTPWTQEYRVVLPVRGERWLHGEATPERQADGAVLWSGFIQDITERRAAEQVVREHFASERASQAKSEFLSRVSHELRTPLNALLGFAHLIQAADELAPRTRDHIGHVHEAGLHLLALVDDLLDLGRIERGHLGLHIGPVDAIDVVSHKMTLIEPLAAERGVRVMPLRCDPDTRVQADGRALGQVLLNLLSNGVKYNRAGGRLQVEIRSEQDGVAISVEDEGDGLTPSQQLGLFQPFNRLGAEHSGIPGVGLGLVISRQLVEAMQGRLTAHNRAQGGCRFAVWLPACAQMVPKRPELPGSDEPQRDRRAAPTGKLPLLLCVEDNPVNAMLMQEIISGIGPCHLLLAEDGEMALQLAQLHRPDLLFSDIRMAKMDGLTLVARLRADPELRAMRCIAVSGDAMAGSRELALRAGFDAYWTKPMDIAWLEREVLALHRSLGSL